MPRLSIHQIVFLCALGTLTACSQTPETPAADSGDDAHATTSPAASATAPATPTASNKDGDSDDDTITQIDCAKIFKPEDAIPILGVPAKVSNYTMRDRSCELETANGEHIHVYGGKGDDLTSTIEFKQATIPANSGKYAKLGGVGDEAYWRTESSEVVSRKGDLWCLVSGGKNAHTEGDALKLGELCNKVYASGL